jgi:small subunit ribosomal protein S6
MPDPKNYELAYLLYPSLPEGEILTYAGKLSMLIEESKGTIRKTGNPRRRRLAYPIRKCSEAYFGWITFAMLPENISALNKKLKSQSDLLRYMIVEEDIEKRPITTLRAIPSRPVKQKPVALPQEIKPEEKLDLEALDKKLEEILGK